ncbi:MAG: hypothetical protein WC848_05350 [Parcubacteria group bacterium]|jgi:hypothetical protein
MNERQRIKSGDRCTNNQAGGDLIINYNNDVAEEQKDYGIIGEIFDYLLQGESVFLGESDFNDQVWGNGLGKIPINFSGDSKITIEELVRKTYSKIISVGQFVNDQRELGDEKIDYLVIKIQKLFRDIKSAENHYVPIEKVSIIENMALDFLPKSKRENPEYYFNSLAVALYFFERCDFGKK